MKEVCGLVGNGLVFGGDPLRFFCDEALDLTKNKTQEILSGTSTTLLRLIPRGTPGARAGSERQNIWHPKKFQAVSRAGQ